MNPIARNILVVLAGFIGGSFANQGVLEVGTRAIPLPEGADVSTMEGLADSMKLFTPMNFISPLLAHALGTLAGAFLAAKLAASHHLKCGIAVGVMFLICGILMAIMCGGPTWFVAADLVLAYLPMGYLGGTLAAPKKHQAE